MQPCTISLAAAAWRLISKMEAVAFFLLSFGRVLKVISRIVLEGCKMYKTKLCTSFWSEPKFKFNDYRSILDFQLGPDLNDVQFFCVIHFKIGTVMWYFLLRHNSTSFGEGVQIFLRSALRCLWKYFILWKIGKHRYLQIIGYFFCRV